LRRERGTQDTCDLRFVVDDEDSAWHGLPSSNGRLQHRGAGKLVTHTT
jgi:hypothetical protein